MKNENAKKKYVRFWKLIFGNSKLGRERGCQAWVSGMSFATGVAAVRGTQNWKLIQKIRLRPTLRYSLLVVPTITCFGPLTTVLSTWVYRAVFFCHCRCLPEHSLLGKQHDKILHTTPQSKPFLSQVTDPIKIPLVYLLKHILAASILEFWQVHWVIILGVNHYEVFSAPWWSRWHYGI